MMNVPPYVSCNYSVIIISCSNWQKYYEGMTETSRMMFYATSIWGSVQQQLHAIQSRINPLYRSLHAIILACKIQTEACTQLTASLWMSDCHRFCWTFGLSSSSSCDNQFRDGMCGSIHTWYLLLKTANGTFWT